MATKAQIYASLADDTARKITGDYLDWAAFLGTSSRLYKYPYRDQLLIYAQRPDATACAGYELWNNTMHRYIRRGSKGIALLTAGSGGMGVRYVFDVLDTGTRRESRDIEPWRITEQTEQPVRRMLKCLLWSKSSRFPASRRWLIGGSIEGTSSTALRIPSFRSMMNSTSERPSGRPQQPASPTAFSSDADWSRSCTGRTSPRC